MPVTSSYWKSKPPPGVNINRLHPSALGIRGFWVLNEDAGHIVNTVTGKRGSRAGAINWVGDPSGPSLKSAAASGSNFVSLGTDPFIRPTSLPITVAICATPGVYTTFGQLWIGNDSSNANYAGAGIGAGTTGFVGATYGANTGTTDTGRRTKVGVTALTVGKRVVAFGVLRGPTDISIYLDGKDDGGAYAGTGGDIAYGATTEARLFDASAQSAGTLTTIHWAGIWARALSQSEIVSIGSDPYQLFQPPVWRKYFIPPAVSPPVTVFPSAVAMSTIVLAATPRIRTLPNPVTLASIAVAPSKIVRALPPTTPLLLSTQAARPVVRTKPSIVAANLSVLAARAVLRTLPSVAQLSSAILTARPAIRSTASIVALTTSALAALAAVRTTPSIAALSLSVQAPHATVQVTGGVVALSLSLPAATAAIRALPSTVALLLSALTATGYTPSAGGVTVFPDAAALALSALAAIPSIKTYADVVSLTLTTANPVVAVRALPSIAALELVALTALARSGKVVFPDTPALTLSVLTPIVQFQALADDVLLFTNVPTPTPIIRVVPSVAVLSLLLNTPHIAIRVVPTSIGLLLIVQEPTTTGGGSPPPALWLVPPSVAVFDKLVDILVIGDSLTSFVGAVDFKAGFVSIADFFAATVAVADSRQYSLGINDMEVNGLKASDALTAIVGAADVKRSDLHIVVDTLSTSVGAGDRLIASSSASDNAPGTVDTEDEILSTTAVLDRPATNVGVTDR